MKKRLLSAALALAMALTLLPVSVFAVPSTFVDGNSTTYDGETATYCGTETTTVTGDDVWAGPGWYVKHTDKTVTPNTTNYYKVTKGFLVGSTYYSSMTNDQGKLRSANFTVIGAGNSVALDNNTTSVTVDIYNGPDSSGNANSLLGTTVSFSNTGALTNLTVSDSKYATEVNNGIRNATENRGTVTIPTFAAKKGVTIKLDDVIASGAITLQELSDATTPVPQSNSVTLTNAEVASGITLGAQGNVAANVTNATYTYARQTLTANRRDTMVRNAPGNKIGAIKVLGNSSTVTLWDTTLNGAVDITGTSTTLTIEGNTTGSGDITMVGSVDPKVKTGAGTVNINGTSREGIDDIKGKSTGGTDEYSTSNFTVNVKGSSVVEGIDFENVNVTISNATVNTTDPAVTLKNGSLKIQGNATVGKVTFKNGGTISEFSVTGSKNIVGDVAVATGNTFTTVNIAADNTNTFDSLDLGSYTGHGVHGGKFKSPIAEASETGYLDTSMAYRVKLSDNTYTQYFPGTSEGLSQAVAAAGKTNAAPTPDANGDYTAADVGIVRIGQTAAKAVTLKNEGTVLAVIGFSKPSAITMPAVINGVTYDNWTVTDTQAQSGASYKPGQEFSAAKLQNYILDAQVSAGSVTKITSADNVSTGENKNVTVKLNGNAITLSGAAVSSGDYAVFTVRLNTDLTNKDGAIRPQININWNNKTGKATFDRNSNPGYGITFPDENTLRLDNGTTYTVSASGLKELEGEGVFKTEAQAALEVTVTDPDYKTQQQKDGLIKLIVGNNNGVTAKFDYSYSPAMNQAVNAAMATITESQVKSWRTQAQRAAWQAKKGNISPTATDLTNTGYTDVVLIPYLAVTVTNDNPLTMNLVPSYRVVVKNPGSGGFEDVFKNKTTGDKDGNYIVKQPTSLGTLNSDLTRGNGSGGVILLLNGDVTGGSSTYYAHQDGTYVYQEYTNGFTFLHPGKTGLGTVVINGTDAAISMKRLAGAKHPDGTSVTSSNQAKYSYDSLQAAVDDTIPQPENHEDEIVITSAYTGNGTINVSGLQRIFKITTNGNTTISASASADVRVTDPTTGSTYTIQLLKDNVKTASIIVSTAENGTAAASAVNAKPGDKVTITLNPKEGYTGTVTAKTSTGASVPVTNNGNNTFTFTVPTGATGVTVTPTFTKASELPFTDVAITDSFYPAVKWNYEHNFIKGTTDTTFRPYNTITRAQLVTILYRNAGSPTVNVSSYPYTDINVGSVDAEMRRAIVWATSKNIVEGYGDGRFGPSNPVRNQELAKILYQFNVYRGKAPGTTSANLSNYFSDAASIANWARPYVQWAVANGVMTATSGRQFQPQLQLQRWLVAVDVYNYGLKFGA